MRFLRAAASTAAMARLVIAASIVALLAAPVTAQDSSSTPDAPSADSVTASSTKGLGGDRELFTSSVAYCSAPIAILVTDLNLIYYPGNSTLDFSLSAASTQDDLNITIALSVNAYGIGVFDVNINLCDIADGFLCPLPRYQFSGGGIFPVPEQIGAQVPGIAYRIPDLEAVATLQLTDNSNDEVVGCVQATLSNGHTARQDAVKWATVGFALLAFFSSMMHTSIAQSIGAAQWRIVDVMLAIQQPAITALLSLNFPIVYLEYGANFAWSLGLVNIQSLQSSITQTRYDAGGTGQAVFGKNLTAITGRQYNPFSGGENAPRGTGRSVNPDTLGFFSFATTGEQADRVFNSIRNTFVASTPLSSWSTVDDAGALLKRQQYAPNTGPGGTLNTGGSGQTLPLVTQNVTSTGGIGRYAERNFIAPDNVFLTALTSMMILLAIVIGALLLVLLLALAARMLFYRKYRPHGGFNTVGHWGHRVSQPDWFFGTIALATLGRYLLIIAPVFFIFAFWQWVGGDSYPGHVTAAILFVVLLAALAVFFVPIFRQPHRHGSADVLYYQGVPPRHGNTIARRWGHMAHPFRPRLYWFSVAFLLWWFLRACFISFAQGYGTRQAIGLLVLEVLLFIVLSIFRVGRDKKSDFVFLFMCFARIAAWAVCVAFIPAADVRQIPRAIVAYVLLVVTAIPIIYLFIVTLVDLFSPLLRRKRRDVEHKAPDAVSTASSGEMRQREPHSDSERGESDLRAVNTPSSGSPPMSRN